MLRKVGDESILLDLKTERYLGLDDVSTRIWEVVTTAGFQSAYDALLTEFDVDPERLREDLDQFVQELLQMGLVHQDRA
jgi:hypothetical protein